MSRYYLYCKKADFKKISELFHISPMLARILRNRDLITEKEIDEYLNGGTDKLYDPFQLKGMEEAVPLLFDAIRNNRKIRIIGDYDTDGVCSSYILKSYLNAAGGKADIRLPNRMMEGYGMNAEMVEEAFSDGIELILTCDNGVSSYEAVQKAKEKGIPVIVSDHHEVPEPLIDSEVVIDAKQPGCPYPFKELCGAGVAYKIVSAMNERIKEYLPEKDPASYGPLLKELLVFAGIATIADVVPLIGENRIIAKEGIRLLKETTNQGLKALIRSRNLEMDRIGSFHIGFIIAPCINSAGRLKDAEIALELFEETDEKKAEILAEDLSRLNEERKEMTASQTVAANQYVQEIWKREESLPKILVIFLPDAHESIAGIIAGRLKEDYAR
ncbi:MAG: DHH family phosphoesterase, partial [Parasporobacterium sp.]|nr:DHH family phosphoesterase [Parasporobacterium sp.]